MTPEQAICDQVVSALRGITRALDLHYKRLLREYGLSGPQIIVLKAVFEAAELPVSELARRVHLSHATVTAIVDRLELKSLITRTPNDQDRREVLISLTAEGLTTVGRSPALLHEKFITEFAALDLWEQNQILASLQRVAKMIGTADHPIPLLSAAPITGENNSHSSQKRSRRREKKDQR